MMIQRDEWEQCIGGRQAAGDDALTELAAATRRVWPESLCAVSRCFQSPEVKVEPPEPSADVSNELH